jgi:hypothetical protein
MVVPIACLSIGKIASEHSEEDHAQRVDIYRGSFVSFLVMVPKHLGSHVAWSADLRFEQLGPFLFYRLTRAEIADLNVHVLVKEAVIALQVPVHDIFFFVHKLHPL